MYGDPLGDDGLSPQGKSGPLTTGSLGDTTIQGFAWQLPNVHPYPSTDDDAMQLMMCVTRLPNLVENYLRILERAQKKNLSRNEAAIRIREHQISRIFEQLRQLNRNNFRADSEGQPDEDDNEGLSPGGSSESDVVALIDEARLMWDNILATDGMDNALRWRQPMTVCMERLGIEGDQVRLVLGAKNKYRRSMAEEGGVLNRLVRVGLVSCILCSVAVTITGGAQTLDPLLVMGLNLFFLGCALTFGFMMSDHFSVTCNSLRQMHFDLVDNSYISDSYIFGKGANTRILLGESRGSADRGSSRPTGGSTTDPTGASRRHNMSMTSAGGSLMRMPSASTTSNIMPGRGRQAVRASGAGRPGQDDENETWGASQAAFWSQSTTGGQSTTQGQFGSSTVSGHGGGKAGAMARAKKVIMAEAERDGNNFIQFPFGTGQARVYSTLIHEQLVMIGFNEKRNVVLWNTAAQVSTGFSHSECVGRNLEDLVDVDEELEERIQHHAESFTQESFSVNIHAVGSRFKMTAVLASVVTRSKNVGLVLLCTFPRADDNKILRAVQGLRHHQLTSVVRDDTINLEQRMNKVEELLPKFATNVINRDTETFTSLAEWITLNQLLTTATQRVVKKLGQVENYVTRPKGIAPGRGDTSGMSFIPEAGAGQAPVADKNTRFLLSPDSATAIETVLQYASGKCDVNIDIERSGKMSTLVFTFTPVPLEEGDGTGQPSFEFDVGTLVGTLANHVERAAGTHSVKERTVILWLPCFMPKDLVDAENHAADDSHDALEGVLPGYSGAPRLSTQVVVPTLGCPLNVSLLLSNTIDLHNISYMMMPVAGLTLGAVGHVDQVNWTSNLDVLIADSLMIPQLREQCEKHSVLLVSCLLPKATAPDAASDKYYLSRPFSDSEVFSLLEILDAAVRVQRQADMKLLEEQRLLSLHQDTPWTRGRLLGSGAAGNVYEATNDLTGGVMAVKMFHFSDHNAAAIMKAMAEEISIHCRLIHPNIVRYFYCEHKGQFDMNLFMEKCDESLDSYLTKKRSGCSLQETADITRQIVNALVYLRSIKIVHRDIKPPNILMKNGMCKLTDFGTAVERADGDDFVDDVQGTLQYMAPEVYRGTRYDHSCDIWSVGCVVCMLLNALPDFMRNTTRLGEIKPGTEILLPEELMRAALNPQFGVAADFVDQCLKSDPAQRPSIDALALHPFIAEQMTEAGDLYVTRSGMNMMEESSRAPSIFSICSDDD